MTDSQDFLTHSQNNFGSYVPPAPKYSGTKSYSYYVPMNDGVELAVEVVLPGDMPEDGKVPALLTQTRYWRQMEIRWPFNLFIRPEDTNPDFKEFKPFFTSQGYAIVLVDVRGTGASFGTWPYPWPPISIEDSKEIVDWIVAQPWSNGNIAGYGISYVGTTAELLSVINHPAIKATIPMFNHPDGYIDIALPGGVLNQRFLRDWGNFDFGLDKTTPPPEFGLLGKIIVKGVKPVDVPDGRKKLKAAAKEHADNGCVYDLAKLVTFRDEHQPGIDICVDDITLHKHKQKIIQAGVPTFGFGSWLDAGTADAVIRRFLTFDHPQRAAIGAWEHGGRYHASPYKPTGLRSDPPLELQWAEMLRFFDRYMKGEDNGITDGKRLFYYTMGEETWKQTSTWPPEGISKRRYYLDENNSLSIEAPTANTGRDKYTVDYQATTGEHNRWWEMSGIYNTSVIYSDRRADSRSVLCYTSPPLENDLEITGHPVINLYAASTEADCVFYVYLEDVNPDGSVIYVTEGQLRALHRKVSSSQSPYKLLVPYHSFKEEDVLPLVPGETVEISFGLLPTSVLIKKGHCIRISITGHDQGTFVRLPEKGIPVYTIQRNQELASFIDLPVIQR